MNSLISCPNCGFLQKTFKTMQDNDFITCIKCSYKWIVLDQNSLKKSNIKFILNDQNNNTTTTIDNSNFIKKAKPEAVIRSSIKPQANTVHKNSLNNAYSANNNYIKNNNYTASSLPSEEKNVYKNGAVSNNYTSQNQAQTGKQYIGQQDVSKYGSKQNNYNSISTNNNAKAYSKSEHIDNRYKNNIPKNNNININQANIDKYLNQNKNSATNEHKDSLINSKHNINSEIRKLNENISISNNDLLKAQGVVEKNNKDEALNASNKAFKSSINLNYNKNSNQKIKDFDINDITIKEEIDVDNLFSIKDIKEKAKQQNKNIDNKDNADSTISSNLKLEKEVLIELEDIAKQKKDKIKETLNKLDDEIDFTITSNKNKQNNNDEELDEVSIKKNKNFFDEALDDLEVHKKYSLWSEFVNKIIELNKPQNILKLFVYTLLVLLAIFLFKNSDTKESPRNITASKEIPLTASIAEQLKEDNVASNSNSLGGRASRGASSNSTITPLNEDPNKEVILLDSDKILNNKKESISTNISKATPNEVKSSYFNGLYLSLKTKTSNLFSDLSVVKTTAKFKSSLLEKHLEATVLIKNSGSSAYTIKTIELVFVDQSNTTIKTKIVPLNQFIEANQSINLILKLPDAPFNTFDVYAFIDSKIKIN
jgi:hypothetical protein